MILADFCYQDPTPDLAEQNETDPNGSGSATLLTANLLGSPKINFLSYKTVLQKI